MHAGGLLGQKSVKTIDMLIVFEKKLSQHLLYHLLSQAPPFPAVVGGGETASPTTPMSVILPAELINNC